MTLPIYQQVRRDVPCEWLCDDEQDEPTPPSRWDTYYGFFWALVLVGMLTGIGYMALTGVRP